MARLRAVVVIQAPGLSGMPRSGHVSRAAANASWTASSASSKSPRTRMRVATARPCSRRNRRSTTSRAAPTYLWGASNSMIGRTSIEPVGAAGIRDAASMAWSRFSHSTS